MRDLGNITMCALATYGLCYGQSGTLYLAAAIA